MASLTYHPRNMMRVLVHHEAKHLRIFDCKKDKSARIIEFRPFLNLFGNYKSDFNYKSNHQR